MIHRFKFNFLLEKTLLKNKNKRKNRIVVQIQLPNKQKSFERPNEKGKERDLFGHAVEQFNKLWTRLFMWILSDW